ncbi:MAG: DMT family transporter [Deltaproteobacteria bacterium]
MNKKSLTAYVALVVAVFFWATNTVIARWVINDIGPFTLSFWRWLFALLIMLPFSINHIKRERNTIWVNKWKLAILALFSVGLYNPILYIAASFTTATNMSIIVASSPISTVIIAWLVIKEVPTKKQIIGVILATIGILVIIVEGSLLKLLTLKFNFGDMLVVILVVVWSLYSVLLKKFQIALHPLSLLIATIFWGLIFCLPFYIAEANITKYPAITTNIVGIVLFLAIFPSVLGYLFWNKSVMEIGASRASSFLYLLPIFCFALAFILLDERMYLYHIAGSTLVFTGLYFATKK